MIISISFGTHGGIVLAFLMVLAFTVIDITLVRRKLNLTRFILAFVLAAAITLGFAVIWGALAPTVLFSHGSGSRSR